LRVFGCTAYAHVDNGKLEPRAVKCIYLGYDSGVKAYKLWNLETKKILMSKNVVFNEAVMFIDSQTSADSDVFLMFLMTSNKELAYMRSMLRRKKLTLLNLNLRILIIILFHPHHLFRSNKVTPLLLTIQGETLFLIHV
jgi:hypothetical protein